MLSLNLKPNACYKIVPPENYTPEHANDCVKLVTLDVKDGFIHASLGTQAQGVLQKFFKGQGQVVLLELDEIILKQHHMEIRMEQNKPGGTFFPHIYGPQQIPAAAVKAIVLALEQIDGSWVTSAAGR